MTQIYELTDGGAASYRTEPKSLNRDSCFSIGVIAFVLSANAKVPVDKLVELFTNSGVADEQNVIVAPGYVGGSQHALLDITACTGWPKKTKLSYFVHI